MDCPVCYYAFDIKDNKKPKILQKCGHTMCQSCIQNMNKTGTLKCPFCKEVYVSTSTDDFPNNYIILNIIEQAKQPTINPQKKVKRLNFSDDEDLECEGKERQFDGMCMEHDEKKYEFYCKQCKRFLCKKCLNAHQKHELVLLEETQESILGVNKSNQKELEKLTKNMQQLKAHFDFLQRDFQLHNQEEIQKADEEFNKIIERLLSKKELLYTEFYDSIQDQEIKIKEKISRFNECLAKIKVQEDKVKELGLIANNSSLDNLYKKGISNFDFTEKINNIYTMVEKALGFSIEEVEPIVNQIENEKKNNFIESGTSILFDIEMMDNSISNFSCVKSNKDAQSQKSKSFGFNDLKDLNGNMSDNSSSNSNSNQAKRELQEAPNKNGLQTSFLNINNILKKKESYKQFSCENTTHSNNLSCAFTNNTNTTAISIENNSNQNSLNKLFSNTNYNSNQSMFSKTTPNNSAIGIRTPSNSFINFVNKACFLSNKKIYTFDIKTKQWNQRELQFKYEEQQRTDKNFQFKCHGAATYLQSNKVFYSGGGPSNLCYILEFQDDVVKIIQMPNMSCKRIFHSIFYIRPYVYIIGGHDGSSRLNQCERINVFKKERFEQIAPMTEARCQFGSCIHKGNIYVFGGLSGTLGKASSTIEKFDPLKGQWEIMKVQLPQTIQGSAAISVSKNNSDRILIFGGCNAGNYSKNIIEYNCATQSIRYKHQKMSQKRQLNNHAFLVGSQIYLIGGNFKYNYEVYDIENQQNIDYDEDYSYGNVIKNDLTNFAMFTNINEHNFSYV